MIPRLQHGPLAPLLAILAGVVAALGFAPLGLLPLTIVGLAVLVALCEAAPARAARLGWAWGLGHFAFSVRWIAEAFTYQDKMPHWLGWLVVLGLGGLLATMPAIACWTTWRFARTARPAARLWVFPAAWMATEWLRGHLFTGFPWNPIAAATANIPGLPLAAATFGVLGLSGFLVFAAADIVLWAKRRPWQKATSFFAVLILTGIAGLPSMLAAPVPAPPVTLRIVQPNIGQADKWASEDDAGTLAILMRLSRGPHPAGARIILWPEVALPHTELERDTRARAVLATLLRPGDLLLTGGLSVDWDRAGRPVAARNSVFVINAQGAILARYDKSHLVPGGEYVPLRPLADLFGLSRLAPGDVDFTPGPGAQTLSLPGLPAVGPLVCYEMIFPGAIVDAAHRPAWLFNPSNDAWFGDVGPPQHLALARLQAIAEGLPIARATPTGVSALIDAKGALLARLPQRAPGVIEMALPPALPPTLYARLGDLIPLALTLMCLALARRAARHQPVDRTRT